MPEQSCMRSTTHSKRQGTILAGCGAKFVCPHDDAEKI